MKNIQNKVKFVIYYTYQPLQSSFSNKVFTITFYNVLQCLQTSCNKKIAHLFLVSDAKISEENGGKLSFAVFC